MFETPLEGPTIVATYYGPSHCLVMFASGKQVSEQALRLNNFTQKSNLIGVFWPVQWALGHFPGPFSWTAQPWANLFSRTHGLLGTSWFWYIHLPGLSLCWPRSLQAVTQYQGSLMYNLVQKKGLHLDMCIYTIKFTSYLSLKWQDRIQPWIDLWMAQTTAKFGNFASQIKNKNKKVVKSRL